MYLLCTTKIDDDKKWSKFVTIIYNDRFFIEDIRPKNRVLVADFKGIIQITYYYNIKKYITLSKTDNDNAVLYVL